MLETAVREARAERAPAARIAEIDVERRLGEILNRHPAVGFAVGVVRGGRLVSFHGHGLADIATGTPVTEDTVFKIGSITKTFTAIAVMQLAERGLVDLDAPANEYLESYKLVPAKREWAPTTVRQLLTHSGGIPEQARLAGVFCADYGQTVELGQRVPSLAEFYRGGLRVVVEPGTVFIYGDHGFATLGQIVEDVSGEPLAAYFREHIFAPLGMARSEFVRSERVEPGLATGYVLGAHGPKAVIDRQLLTAAAGSMYSTTRDMARYVAAMLGGGANEHGSVLQQDTLATMFEPHFQPDRRSPGTGLGFFRGVLAGHRTIEHQGILPGFNSQIWFAPDDGIGLLAFTNGSPQAVMWMPVELGPVLAELLGGDAERIRGDVPQHPEVWGDICGWYSLPVPLTDPRSHLYAGAGAEVIARHGQLVFRLLTPLPAFFKGFPLHPDDESDPYVFRIDLSVFGSGSTRVLFSPEAGGGMRMVPELGVMPVPLRKGRDSMNPRIWATRVAVAVATLTAARMIRGRRRR